ncbi:MAG: hypothetical protein HYU30_06930 [Chloroflexi bacterium]|nr:hypothetical protein [Chloroflexota bacterium]
MGAKRSEIVIVTWRDARFYPETRNTEKMKGIRMAVFESVGHLISRDDTTTIIAAELNDEGDYRDVTLIPSGSIESVRRLSLGSPLAM